MEITKVQTFDGVHKGFFSRDGARLALMDQSYADVIETATGRKLSRIGPRNTTFLGVTFSPDGRLLATVDRFNETLALASIKVTLWDAASGREKLTLPTIDHDWRRVVDDLTFSPDGRLLASNIGGIARLWNVATGNEERRFPPPAEPAGIEAERALLSPSGRLLAVYFRREGSERGYHAVHLFSITSGERTVLHAEVYSDWAFSADSKLLVVSALVDKGKPNERSVAQVWDVASAQLVRSIEVPREWQGAFAVGLSPDGNLMAVGGREKFGIYSVETGMLLTEETHAARRLSERSELFYDLTHVEFSPDGSLLLTGGNDGTVKLWRVVR